MNWRHQVAVDWYLSIAHEVGLQRPLRYSSSMSTRISGAAKTSGLQLTSSKGIPFAELMGLLSTISTRQEAAARSTSILTWSENSIFPGGAALTTECLFRSFTECGVVFRTEQEDYITWGCVEFCRQSRGLGIGFIMLIKLRLSFL